MGGFVGIITSWFSASGFNLLHISRQASKNKGFVSLIFLFVLTAGFCASQAGAVAVANSLIVTSVQSDSDTFRVVIDRAVEIRNIVMVSSNGVTNAVFPKGVRFLNEQGINAVTNAISKGVAGKIAAGSMSYKIGDIAISTGPVRDTITVESSTPTFQLRTARQVSNGSKAKCVVTFNNGLEFTAYIFDRDNKRRVSWSKDVKIKNHLLSKMIGKSVLNKYKVVVGDK